MARSGLVDRVFIQPDAGDAGGALGAAYLAQRELGGSLPRREFRHAYWGPSFTTAEIIAHVELINIPYEIINESDVPSVVSDLLADQQIVGWFQGASEWGPRALGARSILADPRREDIRDRINCAI